MARLLRLKDYDRAIQSDNLAQVVGDNYTLLIDVEQSAQLTMIGHLKQRYQVNRIFQNLSTFNLSATYKGTNLVEYTETAFSATTIYTTGQRVVYNSNIYASIAGSTAHAFNVSEWTLICEDKLLYNVTLPYPEFNIETTYSTNDVVWFNDYTYICKQPLTGILPSNSSYWTIGTLYSITNTYPTDATKWTLGDNRNQEIVQNLIDITLYNLHCRINPRNVPDLRKERYDGNEPQQRGGALGWLKNISKGNVYLDCPVVLPEQGNSISWGNSNGLSTAPINYY